jgi:hypothetical protein
VDLSVGEKKMLIVLAYLANLKSLKPALKTLTGCIFETISIVSVLIINFLAPVFSTASIKSLRRNGRKTKVAQPDAIYDENRKAKRFES